MYKPLIGYSEAYKIYHSIVCMVIFVTAAQVLSGGETVKVCKCDCVNKQGCGRSAKFDWR